MAVSTGYGAGLAGLGAGYGAGAGYGTGSNCICSLPTLVILILIVLQFSKGGKCCDDDGEDGCGGRHYPIGNGILFIIALFFLSCSGCGRGASY